MVEGFRSDPPICGDEDKIDPLISLGQMTHVTDADSSQALVIEEVRRQRHLVVQGPPGTGKSQTITNIIATAVKEGKKVLFVAEKMAALDVVKNRLERLGLGAIGLELHSNKANKRLVLEELGRTLDLGRPKVEGAEPVVERLAVVRDRLNQHAEALNAPIMPAGVTPYQMLGEMVKIMADGVGTPTFSLPDPATWSKSQVQQRERQLQDFMQHAKDLGPPAAHPWRGVRRTTPLLPSELATLRGKIERTLQLLDAVEGACRDLSNRMRVQWRDSPTLHWFQSLYQLAEWVFELPLKVDRKALAHECWNQDSGALDDLVNRGKSWAEQYAAIAPKIAPSGWETDPAPIRRVVAGCGRSWLRWFNSEYRKALADLRGLLAGQLPKTYDERVELLDDLCGIRAHQEFFASSGDSQGRTAFGSQWQSRDSPWELFDWLLKWNNAGRHYKLGRQRGVLPKMGDPQDLSKPLQQLRDSMSSVPEILAQISTVLELKLDQAFGQVDWNGIPLKTIRERLQAWRDAPEELSKWISYSVRFTDLEKEGLGGLLKEFVAGRVDTATAVRLFRQAYCEAMVRHVWMTRPELTRFDGKSHESLVQEFCSLDQQRFTLARREVAAVHFGGIPHDADHGEMSILRSEISKKRRHMPIRKLLKEAGRAIQAIKPVFMMSPISIAQFLTPGTLEFDIMVMDEASQVSAEDAIGAVARSRQIVVVGDSKQLPPTRFFNKVMEDTSTGEDDEIFNTGDIESILGLCLARGLPQRMLRWHYRSRHHSLIAVSNREFYDHKLIVIPSPTTAASGYGLQMRLIKNGVFDRGGTATNKVEAQAVANAILEHARVTPEKSLGVGTFSVAQRDTILNELELLRRQSPATESFFQTSNAEPFFVKNLENIQGEERDVIFISIGYAKDASGFMAMSFGPLTADGGERRLNVLISRAKEICVVFSSIEAKDIDLSRAKTIGPRALKAFLGFAATGEMDVPAITGRDFDSDFERQVAVALRQYGHTINCQVGTAGFVIDLAVVDPENPGRYLLGIECDGATYHSARWARDRDRLREQVLLDRGWQIHRIWSTDWFNRREEQLRKTLDAIEKAKRRVAASEPVSPPKEIAIERDQDLLKDAVESTANPYQEAEFAVPQSPSLQDVPTHELAEFARLVVKIEGPVHRDEIARRLCSLWGFQRLGSRIESAVEKAVDHLVRTKTALDHDGFITLTGQIKILARNRAGTRSPGLRKPEYLPPAEVREATHQIVERNIGVTRDEATVAVARLLGFSSTTTKLRDSISAEIEAMITAKVVEMRDERLFMAIGS